MSTPSVLDVEDLCLWRGETLLIDGFELTLSSGEAVQIHGDNGAGKTTLLRVLAGLSEADDGEVRWCGQPIRRCRTEFHHALLYLGHKPGISLGLTAIENLELILGLDGEDSTRESANAGAEVLNALGLGDRLHLPCSQLSAGQRRRVALARLALQHRTLWILDEPLAALDPHGVDWVRTSIERHCQGGGSVLFTTHQALPLAVAGLRRLSLVAPS